MDQQDFIAIGQYLYGERWATSIARLLDMQSSNVHIYKSKYRLPDDKAQVCYSEVAKRQIEDVYPLLDDLSRYHEVPVLEIRPKQRQWSKDSDREIKKYLAQMLTQKGIKTVVVDEVS